MARDYHSSSSIDTADGCRHAWGLRYLSDLRYDECVWQPEAAFAADFKWPDWVDHKRLSQDVRTRLINKQRSSALGKAMHAVGEGWYLGHAIDWNSEPAKIFTAGAHLLPHPSRVHDVRIEQPIGDIDYVSRHFGPTKLLDVGAGVRMMGFIDLEVYPFAEESARLGLPPGWAVCDYKSTKSFDWIKKPEVLLTDGQAALYAYAHAHSERGAGATPPQRWVYFLTKGARAARAVDVRPTYRDATSRVHLMIEQAHRLDSLESIDQCMPNPDHCPKYGGCEYHVDRGGPCTAERNLGAAVNQVTRTQNLRLVPLETTMDQQPAQGMNRFAQLAAARRAGTQAPAPAPAPAPVAPSAPPVGPGARNSFGTPGNRTRGRAAQQQAAAAPPPPPPQAPELEVVDQGVALSTGPKFTFTITCDDPAELAAIAELVARALGQ